MPKLDNPRTELLQTRAVAGTKARVARCARAAGVRPSVFIHMMIVQGLARAELLYERELLAPINDPYGDAAREAKLRRQLTRAD